MTMEFDLLGDPIPEGWGKRGRPPHMPTEEKRRLVRQLLAFGWPIEKIAAAMTITPPTLRKNYFRELRYREEARAAVEGKLLSALMNEVEKGNVSAIDKYFRLIEKHDLKELAARVAHRPGQDAKPQKLGKKEQQSEAAKRVGGKYAPPPPPSFFN